ncbi:hypothetical protein INT47_007891 [Mucor saturninus]|uniref:Uncharacterized protein n=1 Tax=Mucor saturninus TaxID=64648 RepID=A0A8H7UY66_9FUNG|nr:hypothetical protein INT47_007891 [Mucor saturninus]
MLSNPSFVETLPDKGDKLRETNEIIKSLLTDGRTATSFDKITVSNTLGFQDCPLTKKLEEMSVLTPRQGARKRSVDHANQQAFNPYASPGLLTKPRRSHGSCPSIFYPHQREPPAVCDMKPKVRMITLDESVSLQTEQRSSVIESHKELDIAKPGRSLLRSLNLSIDLIQEVDIDQVELPNDESDDAYDPMLID